MTANEFIEQVEQCRAANWQECGLINKFMFDRIARHLKGCEHCQAGFNSQFDFLKIKSLNQFDKFFSESNNLDNWTCKLKQEV